MGNLLNLIAGGTNALAMAAEEMDMDVQPLADALMTSMWADWGALAELLIRFVLNTAVIALIVRVFYYPKSKRRDYFFTFILISISVFLLIFLMAVQTQLSGQNLSVQEIVRPVCTLAVNQIAQFQQKALARNVV